MEAAEILPIDCWRSIFSYLDDKGLEAVSLVCKDFLIISNAFKDSLQVVHPELGMLSRHLKRFKQLKKINFRFFQGDMEKAILETVRCEVSLDVLEICLSKSRTKELDTISKLNGLKTLNLVTKSGCLRNNDLVLIANSFSNLEQLELSDRCDSGLALITDYGVELLASKLKFLKKIHIFGRLNVSDRSVIALSLNCAFLKDVTIYNWFNMGIITENGIGHLLRNRPNLEALLVQKIDPSWSSITIENSISHAKALTSLKFSSMNVSDMLLNAIAKAKLPLKEFELSYCGNFTNIGLLMVSPYLTRLNIELMDMTPFLQLLLNSDVGKLTHIDINYRNATNCSILIFLLSIKCPSLVDISMKFAKFDRKNIELPQNHNILSLCLHRCEIDDESVIQFARMFPNLRVVVLVVLGEGMPLTSTGIEAMLKSCKFIRELMLEGYVGTKPIKDNSEVLNLEGLDLENSSIVDEGLAAIAKRCRRLVSLNLNFCRNVTTEGIKHVVKTSRP